MSNVVFICSSSKINKYLYLIILSCLENFAINNVSIFIDENCKLKFPKFSNFVNYIDHRFSNFRIDPIEIIDLVNIDKIRIINDISLLKDCDWIILETKNFDHSIYDKIPSLGILSLNFNCSDLKKSILNKNELKLDICCKKTDQNNWQCFSTILKSEKGIKNSVSKILLNYDIYLQYFLLNHSTIKLLDYNDRKVLNLNSQVDSISYYFKLILNLLYRKYTLKKLRWKIAIKQNDKYFFLDQPIKSFWADPFIVSENNRNYIFFEELKPDGIGAIACLELNEKFKIIKKEIVIDKEYHLSFPNVFCNNGAYYMIPESSANNSLDIYKSQNFPYEWCLHKILIDKIRLIDPVLFFHDNIYWIFANKIEDFEFDNNERLYLYYSNDLFSDNWTAHLQNPIINDASCARNGGKIYQKDDKIYRVSQNCSSSYGKNLVVNEITNLTTSNYSEKKDHETFPHKKFKGMHTMNFINDIQVFDFLDSKK